MKNLLWKWSLGLGLMALPLAGGCLQDHSKTTFADTNTGSGSVPVVLAPANNPDELSTATNAPAPEADEAAAEDADVVSAPARPISIEKSVPPNLKINSAATEIIKLANAGVDESVMLAYVTNSSYTFNLGADELVYLRDIGVPSVVATAMIQQDQAIKTGGMSLPPSTALTYAGTNILVPTPGSPSPYPVQPSVSDSIPEPVAADPNSINTAPPAEGQAQTAPATTPTYDTFYDSLSPYGTWLEVEGYGRVWQPTVVVVNRNWRPYYDSGRWMYTDVGWYWYSDYSWGWAPFHYGRWFRHSYYGWCWSPDYVWGPSWVTWRYSPGYCGWAPLPPAAYYSPGFGFTYYGSSVGVSFGWGLGWSSYSFVPIHSVCHPHVYRHGLHQHDVKRIYHQTKVVNKIVGDNNVIINNGIPIQEVEKASKRSVPRVPVRQLASAPERGSRGEQLTARGELAVHRPAIAAPADGGPQRLAPRRPETLRDSTRGGSRGFAPNPDPAYTAAPNRGTPSRLSGPDGDRLPTTRTAVARPVPTREQDTPEIHTASPSVSTRATAPLERPTRPDRTTENVISRSSTPSAASAAPAPNAPSASAVTRPAPSRPQNPIILRGSERDSSRPTVSSRTIEPREPRPVTPSYNQRSYSPPAPSTTARPAERPDVISRPNVTPQVSTPSRSRESLSGGTVTAPSRSTPAPAAPSRPSYSAPAPRAAAPSYSAPAPAPVRPSYSAPAPRAAAPSYSAPSPSVRSMPSPSYSAPSPARSAPSYSAPAPSRPSPSYSAPSRSAPSYSAPAPSRPSPSPSAPARSAPAPSRSEGGSQGRGPARHAN